MTHQIDTEVCINCGACETECPNQAISEVDGTYTVEAAKCDDCNTCESACPVDAIHTA